MDASNMYAIDLISKIDRALEGTKKRTSSEVVEELVKPIAAVKLTESETESVTADSAVFPISKSTQFESVTAGPTTIPEQNPKIQESVTAGSTAPRSESITDLNRAESVTAGSSVSSMVRSESISAGSTAILPPPTTSSNLGTISNRYSCRVCNRRHSLRDCKQFKNMSLDARIKTVADHRDCTRCLGKWHQARDCHSRRCCLTCGGDHHTLLHEDRSNVGSVSKPLFRTRQYSRSNPYPSYADRQNYRSESRSSVDHLSVSQTVASPISLLSLQSVSTLSPSLIVRLHGVGSTYPVRAVLDPCATQSQVCASMVDHLKLPISNLDGVQFCRFAVTSMYDPTESITITARVTDLKFVFTPKETVSEKLKDAFLGLPLADPSFYRPSRVALVLGPDVYAKVVTNRMHVSPGLPIAHNTIFGWVLSGACYH
ncbi:uncharacterized protein [Musca autumnalis]|uniref:uncharacterized protein n=1 Tax=Musca autumnalis TaxID=221902 RepID=UPI003CEE0445